MIMLVCAELMQPFFYSCFILLGSAACYLLSKSPKYVIYTYFNFLRQISRMKKKRLKLSDRFSVSYIERGSIGKSGPSILFLHGFSSEKESFCTTVYFMANRYHVVSVDLFGHGETSTDEGEEYSIATYVKYLKQFVDGVGLSKAKFHMVGMSLGGHIGGIYATAYPQDVVSLTMICPHGIRYPKEDVMRQEAERTGKFIFLPQNNQEFRKMIRWLFYNRPYLPGLVVAGGQQIRDEKNVFYRRALESLYEPHSIHLLEKKLSEIHTPLMLVWGREDACVSLECVETIKGKLPVPPRDIVILDNVGHAVQFEVPRQCAQILQKFVDSFK